MLPGRAQTISTTAHRCTEKVFERAECGRSFGMRACITPHTQQEPHRTNVHIRVGIFPVQVQRQAVALNTLHALDQRCEKNENQTQSPQAVAENSTICIHSDQGQ